MRRALLTVGVALAVVVYVLLSPLIVLIGAFFVGRSERADSSAFITGP